MIPIWMNDNNSEGNSPRLPSKLSGDEGHQGDDTSGDIRSVVDAAPRVDTPKLYKVILLNDDYTPMDFVITVLKRFFAKSDDDASKIMMDVHHQGSGIAGVFSLESAEMKVMQVNQFARQNQHPLKSSLEPE